MTVRAMSVPLLGLLALATTFTYLLKPLAEPAEPLQDVALAQDAPATVGSTRQVFALLPQESQARFVIDEVLQGSPKTVVGSTNQVAGQLAADPTHLAAAQLGTFTIDARTFATDSSQRDRALQNFVLKTAQHQYISFTPSVLIGLPATTSIGQIVPVWIQGDLTIGDVTRPVTFDATITPESPDRLAGSASSTIRYADWGISIPQVPLVASVADTVQLQLDFAATAV
jgi:polyisoprenoid-binding protein YceI